jgi:hypothetical protein
MNASAAEDRSAIGGAQSKRALGQVRRVIEEVEEDSARTGLVEFRADAKSGRGAQSAVEGLIGQRVVVATGCRVARLAAAGREPSRAVPL